MKHNLAFKIIIVITFFFSTILLETVEANELIGITWGDSRLVSFDPYSGKITDTHVQLNPNESFRGLAYDPNHKVLYALSQVDHNLYAINPTTLHVQHLGNLHFHGGGDAGALAYDPNNNILYTAWEGFVSSSQLCEINLDDLELKNKGNISSPFVSSFAFNKLDNYLYGLAVYGSGSWDSPYKSYVVKINPIDGDLSKIFETPYHTVMGFAKMGDKNHYYSWINWTSHFYGKIDIENQTVTGCNPI